MSTPSLTRIRLQIICEVPPLATFDGQPTEFGLQDKQQVLHPGVPQPDGALRFGCEAHVKPHSVTGAPDFGDAFVHGSAGARFLYLGWRPLGGAWIKRFKVPLAPIDWEQIASARNGALVARTNTTRSGTVALLGAGWTANGEP